MTIVTNAHMHHIDPSVTRRQKIESRIASRAVSALLAAGYSLSVAQGGEDEQPATTSKRKIMELLGECDEDYLFVYAPAPSQIKAGWKIGWVHLVYGNDGNDVIADYTCTLESQLAAVLAYAETL